MKTKESLIKVRLTEDEAERLKLYAKRCGLEELKSEKASITQHIMPLRRSLAAAAEIALRSARMREKLAIIQELEQNEKQRQQSKQKGAQRRVPASARIR